MFSVIPTGLSFIPSTDALLFWRSQFTFGRPKNGCRSLRHANKTSLMCVFCCWVLCRVTTFEGWVSVAPADIHPTAGSLTVRQVTGFKELIMEGFQAEDEAMLTCREWTLKQAKQVRISFLFCFLFWCRNLGFACLLNLLFKWDPRSADNKI